jgi:hypothetical protein
MLDLGQIPSLETKRLLLRRPLERDVDALAAVFAEPSYMRFLGDGETADRDAAWRAIACALGHWALRGNGFFAVEEKASGAFIGWSGLLNPGGWPGVEIAWGIAPSRWRQGFCQRGRQSGAKLRVEHASNDALDQLDPSRQRSLDPRRGEDRRMLSPPDRISRQAAAALRHNVIARVRRSRLSR